MAVPLTLHPDRLFPVDPVTRGLARALYETVADLPIVSPHGHTDPQWFADDEPFANASALLIVPDHYVFRMLYSQGVRLEDLGVARRDGGPVETDGRRIWRLFAEHYHLFRGTPTRAWLDHAFATLFGLDRRLSAEAADRFAEIFPSVIAGKTGRHNYTEWDQVLIGEGAAHAAMNPYHMSENRDCRRAYSKDMCQRSLDILNRTVMVPMHPLHTAEDIADTIHNIEVAARVALGGMARDEADLRNLQPVDAQKFDMTVEEAAHR